MEEDKIIDQSPLAEDLSGMIPYEFFEFFLIKPLDPVKVKKEFSKPVSKGSSKDENGIEAEDFENVETEVKEVDSDYRRGVVIKTSVLMNAKNDQADNPYSNIKPGDVVIFRETAGLRFDLVKDSRLLRPYDILGTERVK